MDDPVTMIAHRGFSREYPENTLEAFRAAAAHADWIELDVQQCASGEIMVYHNLFFNDSQFPGLEGGIWEYAFDTIRGFQLENGEPLPTLSEVFAVVPDDVTVVVEMKALGITDFSTRFLQYAGVKLSPAVLRRERERWHRVVSRVIDVVDGFGNEVVLSSFFEPALAAAKRIDPSISRSFLSLYSWQQMFEAGAEIEAEVLAPWRWMVYLNPSQVYEARDRGYTVHTWTAHTEQSFRRLASYGVDGIFADHPFRLQG